MQTIAMTMKMMDFTLWKWTTIAIPGSDEKSDSQGG